jgi:hypothetical protein
MRARAARIQNTRALPRRHTQRNSAVHSRALMRERAPGGTLGAESAPGVGEPAGRPSEGGGFWHPPIYPLPHMEEGTLLYSSGPFSMY